MKNEIGTDPTLVDVIETLDVPVNNGNQNSNEKSKKPKKKGSFIKNFLFTLLILILMGGVAFGVYYYLKLGKENSENTTSKSMFTLLDMSSYVGSEISSNVYDYGNFSKVDISKCKIDLSSVDNEKEGEYTYSVTCDNTTKSAKYIIKAKENVIANDVNTNIIFIKKGSEINPQRLVSSENDYTFVFENADEVKNILNNEGLQKINIKAILNDEEKIVTSFVYVINEDAKIKFNCESPNEKIVDKILFNNDKLNMNNSIRIYKYKFDTKENFLNNVNEINNGELTIEDNKGYALINYDDNEIDLVTLLTKDILDKEYNNSFPSSYSDISNYYRNTLKYTCVFD